MAARVVEKIVSSRAILVVFVVLLAIDASSPSSSFSRRGSAVRLHRGGDSPGVLDVQAKIALTCPPPIGIGAVGRIDVRPAMLRRTFQLEYLEYLRHGILITPASTPRARIISRIARQSAVSLTQHPDAASRTYILLCRCLSADWQKPRSQCTRRDSQSIPRTILPRDLIRMAPPLRRE